MIDSLPINDYDSTLELKVTLTVVTCTLIEFVAFSEANEAGSTE